MCAARLIRGSNSSYFSLVNSFRLSVFPLAQRYPEGKPEAHQMARGRRHELVADSTSGQLRRLHQSAHPPHARGTGPDKSFLQDNVHLLFSPLTIKLALFPPPPPQQCQPHIQKAAKPSVEGICAKVYHHSIEYAKRIKDKHVVLLRYATHTVPAPMTIGQVYHQLEV